MRLLAALLLIAPALALGQEAYCVDDSTDTVGAYRADLQTLPCPAGSTGVELDTIAAAYDGPIYQGGTWTADTYTPPASQQEPTTPAGIMRAACVDADERIVGLMRDIRDVWRKVYPYQTIRPALTMLVLIRHGYRGVVLQTGNADWTPAARLAFIQAPTADGFPYRKPEDVLTYFHNQTQAGTPVTVAAPNRMVWVNPATGAVVTDFADILAGGHDAAMVANASDITTWAQSPGGWCREIQ